MRIIYLIIALFMSHSAIKATAPFELKGVVIDRADNPIDSVAVTMTSKQLNSYTNELGEFSIKSEIESVELRFSHPDFNTVYISVNPNDSIIVSLDKNVKLSEVSITARRTENTHSKSPISLHSLSQGFIEKNEINSLDRVEQFSPSFTFDQLGFSKSRIAIRGLGSDNTTLGQDFSSSVFLNGMHMNTTGLAKIEVFDMESVEVFRGSHSSKWGKNVIGGGINFITAKPKAYNYSKVSARFASYGEVGLNLMNNLVISDKLNQRIALSFRRNNGYSQNNTLDKKLDNFSELGLRYSVAYKPNQNFSIDLVSDFSNFNSDGNAYTLIGGNTNGKRSKVFDYLSQERDLDSRQVSTEEIGAAKKLVYGSLINMTYKKKNYSIELNSGFRNIHDVYFNNQIGFSNNEILVASDLLDERAANYSIGIADSLLVKYSELRIKKGFNFGDLGIGFFVNNESGNSKTQFISTLIEGRDVESNPNFIEGASNGAGAIILNSNNDIWNNNLSATDYAIFNYYSFNLFKKLQVDASVRYSINKKKFNANTLESSNSLISGEQKIVLASHIWKNLSWNLDFAYELSDNSMIYLLAGTGFKPGGYSLFVSTDIIGTPLENETSLSYEFGYKNKFSDKLYGTINLFNARYNGLQTIQFTDNGIFATNAEETILRGIETEVDFVSHKLVNARLSYSYLHSEVNGYQDLNGLQLQRAPKHELMLAINKRIDKITISSIFSYRSEVFDDPDNDLGEVRPARTLWDANLGYRFPKNISIKLFAKNLLNQVYYLRTTNSYDARVATLGSPRVFGISIKKMIL